MAYILTEEVTDTNASTRVKTLLAALTHVITSVADVPKRKHEFRSIAFDITSAQKKLKEENLSDDAANTLAKGAWFSMEEYRKEAELKMNALESEKDQNIAREKYLQKALVEEGYYDWRNRSIRIESYGVNPEYTFKDDEAEDILKMWKVDCQKIMERFQEDFNAALPEGVPKEAFDMTCFEPFGARQKATVGAMTFNSQYEDVVKEIILKLTELNVDRVKESDPERYQPVAKKGGLNKVLMYDDAQYIGSGMPYVIETDTPGIGLGHITLDLLMSDDKEACLEETRLNEQYPLLNISEWAKNDGRLKAFMDEPFGGSIGRDQRGFEKAMIECARAYSEEYGKKLNIQKVISGINREMEKNGNEANLSMQ